jgi:hypothetical protein
MKNLIVLILALFSLSAFANVDTLVGNYKSTTAEAKISKKLVSPATLFDPAVYEYYVQLESSKFGVYVVAKLTVDAAKKSLSAYTDDECDDPGCTFFTDIKIDVSNKAGKPSMEVYVLGYQDGEDGREDKEIEGTFKLAKIK